MNNRGVCDNLTNCTDGVCELCPLGFSLDGPNCKQCDNNCSRCSISNTSQCTGCSNGWYLYNSKCYSCPTGCRTCTNSHVCLTCNNGYVLELSSIQFNHHICRLCLYPCSTCIGNEYSCTACADGFMLDGWKCLSTFNFGLQILL